jgi:hypothetical protein
VSEKAGVFPSHRNLDACAVRQFTADGVSVGRCWYTVTAGMCPLHGDVAGVQKRFAETGELTDETKLPKHVLRRI